MSHATSGDSYDYEGGIPVGYYDDVFARGRGIQSNWHRFKFLFVQSRLEQPKRHLDIGCGPGTFIGHFRKSPAVGLDISHRQISYAQKKYEADDAQFKTMTPGQLPFPDHSFDLITMIEVVEHLTEEDVDVLFAECARVLEPGGRLLVTTPNYRSMWPAIELVLNAVAGVSYEDQHINKYERHRLAAQYAKRRFEAVTVSTFQLIAPFLSAVGEGVASYANRTEARIGALGLGNLLFGEGRTAK